MPYRCAIYGLGISANRPVPGVPPSGTGPLDVCLSFGALPAWVTELESGQSQISYTSEYTDGSGKPLLHVFRLMDGRFHHFCYADHTEFLIDDTGSQIWCCWREPLTIEDAATYLLGPVLGFVLLLRGTGCLHGSAVVIDDEAIAIVGPAGSGKSTTAAAFSSRQFSVLAEDVVTLDDRVDHCLVRPAYPCIRLWPASVKALYGCESHLPRLTPNWDKRYLDLREQFHKQPVPLSVIYLLGERRDGPDAPFVEEVERTDALLSLIANTYTNYLMDKTMRARQFQLLTRVLAKIPVRRITPHADARRIQELCDCILDDFAVLERRLPLIEPRRFTSVAESGAASPPDVRRGFAPPKL